MDHTFKQHTLSEVERTWLAELAATPRRGFKTAKVRLHGRLPKGFDPAQIDRRLLWGTEVTLLGRWLLGTDPDLARDVDSVIRAIREAILVAEVEEIGALNIAKAIGLAAARVRSIMGQLSPLGHFYSSASGNGDVGIDTYRFGDDKSYDEYLEYTTLDDLLERFYLRLGPATEGAAGLSRDFETTQRTVAVGATRPGVVKPSTAFVLMSMNAADPALEGIHEAIKDACARFGIQAFRADELEHQGKITDRVIHEILTCEHLIADLTGERQNVYYEVGFAHAVGKSPILFRRKGTKLHFDLAGHNVPEYVDAAELNDFLYRRLGSVIREGALTRDRVS
jgi:hypothetical protein